MDWRLFSENFLLSIFGLTRNERKNNDQLVGRLYWKPRIVEVISENGLSESALTCKADGQKQMTTKQIATKIVAFWSQRSKSKKKLLNDYYKTYLELKFFHFMKANPHFPIPILYFMSSFRCGSIMINLNSVQNAI